MKNVQLFVIAAVMLAFGQTVSADERTKCPPGTNLSVIGTVSTASRNVSDSGHQVVASRVACAGTACVAGIYDADTLPVLVNADVKDEPGAPANTSTWTDYDPPLAFKEGITVVDDGNVNAALFYECRP